MKGLIVIKRLWKHGVLKHAIVLLHGILFLVGLVVALMAELTNILNAI